MRFLFFFLLCGFLAIGGTSSASAGGVENKQAQQPNLPESLQQSLKQALATDDAFVIDATFNAVEEKYPHLTQAVVALRGKNAEDPQKLEHQTTKQKQTEHADTPKEPPVEWTGTVTAAYDRQTGNTETENFLTQANLERESARWRHRLSGRVRLETEDSEKISEEYRTRLRSDRKISETMFIFADAEYVTDKFSGFDYRVTESIGLGNRWRWDDRTSFFDARVSAGGRHLKEVGDANAEHNGILKPSIELDWHMSDRVNFNQKANSTMGTEVTITETETSLNYALNNRLALKLAFQLEHTSSVAPGTEKLDTYTSTGLTYQLFE